MCFAYVSRLYVSLSVYKVRILDADRATAASVRVMIDFRYNQVASTGSDATDAPEYTYVNVCHVHARARVCVCVCHEGSKGRFGSNRT